MKLLPRACLALFVCLPVLSWAQPSSAAEQAQTAPPSAPLAPALMPRSAPQNSLGRIRLDVVVTDKAGKPVPGLQASDFTLLDNNLPSKILSFREDSASLAKAEPPVEVILLLDTVNLPFSQVSFARQQIEVFLRQNGGRLAQPVSLFVLTSEGLDAMRQPTTDGNALAETVNHLDSRLRTIGNSAGAWGAVERFQFSVRMLSTIADDEVKMSGRKLLIWVCPGWPMLDQMNLGLSDKGQQRNFDKIVELSTRLREARVSVYSVSSGQPSSYTNLYKSYLKGVKTAEKANPLNLDLKVLAVQSGGRALTPSNDLTSEIDSCVQDASAFYTLSFDPPRADHANEYHDLKVVVNQPNLNQPNLDKPNLDKPKLTARTSTGYYIQP